MNDCRLHLANCSFQNFRFWISGSVRVSMAVHNFSIDSALLFCSRSLRSIMRPGRTATEIACAFLMKLAKPFSEVWPLFNNLQASRRRS
ncbi:hypothetical protein AYI70_g3161 [Smittium culicis]|uniref:Uncharacterized protein n=1 Tax=Smittium culicis TaxID=133412 RepID=A0A1R1Y4Y6_9FUNG|nr:hypothetical protein AYI70_g3161 [Smittium culicis]